MLSKAQIELLEALPLNKWVSHKTLPLNTHNTTLKKLISENKCAAIMARRPTSITDKNVETGLAEAIIEKFSPGIDWHQSFIKKIEESYRTNVENKAVLLETKVQQPDETVQLLTEIIKKYITKKET